MSASKFLLKSLLKQPRRPKRSSGFTLLELLVGLVLTFLIITPLMSLVISVMNTDRQEQAKNSSQQEIQAALDYIAQDLQQAVYVYDASALSRNTNTTDLTLSGIKNQIPPEGGAVDGCSPNQCVPVLAFWKRKYLDRGETIDGVDIAEIDDLSQGSDRFVYSLVVYYLIKDNTASSTWSGSSRIGRFEVRDGIKAGNPPSYNNGLRPEPGFSPFDLTLSPTNLQQSMNGWIKNGSYDAQQTKIEILIDYIDDTPLADLPVRLKNQLTPPANDRTDPNTNALASEVCDSRLTSPTLRSSGTTLPKASRVPPNDIIPTNLNTGSFYACVKPINAQGQSVVQLYLRGNALARLNKNSGGWKINSNNLSYAPLANVRVAVRGLLGGDDSN